MRVGEIGMGFRVAENLPGGTAGFYSLTTGRVLPACACGNLCAAGAVNLLLEMSCVHSSALLTEADTVIDP